MPGETATVTMGSITGFDSFMVVHDAQAGTYV